tara:strand:- start:405 stop:521 length:117 start_codon:yes stop_codon:yes gene_type:complete
LNFDDKSAMIQSRASLFWKKILGYKVYSLSKEKWYFTK